MKYSRARFCLTLSIVAAGGSCSSEPPASDPCDTLVCATGQLCAEGQCFDACNTSADCDIAGDTCRDGACRPGAECTNAGQCNDSDPCTTDTCDTSRVCAHEPIDPCGGTFTIGGTVAGLLSGNTVVLRNNGTDSRTVNGNGAFTFTTAVADQGDYEVTIFTEPTGQDCEVTSGGSGTVASANVTNVVITCTTLTYLVGGTLSGLGATKSVVLQNNDGNDLTLSINQAFTFTTQVAHRGGYDVTVLTDPDEQLCTVNSGVGSINAAAVTDIVVNCVDTHLLGGVIHGLAGNGLQLRNNGVNPLSPSGTGNVSFTFPNRVAEGSTYSVSVVAHPTTGAGAQDCVVLRGGTGTVGASDISSVVIECRATRFLYTAHDLDGTVSIYTLDAPTGLPRHAGYVVGDPNGMTVITDPTNRFAFAMSWAGSSVRAYAIDAARGTLTYVNSVSLAGGPMTAVVDPSGEFLYVAIAAGVLQGYAINPSSGALSSIDTDGGTDGVQSSIATGALPFSIAIDATHGRLYTANQNSYNLSGFSIDSGTGALVSIDTDATTVGTQASIDGGYLPNGLVIDPSGRFAYASNWDEIEMYSIDGATGGLTSLGQAAAPQGGQTALAMDPRGLFLYDVRWSNDTMAVYAIDPDTGLLDLVDADDDTAGAQDTISTGDSPSAIALDATGRFVYVSNFGADTSIYDVSVYERDPTTGAVVNRGRVTTRGRPRGLGLGYGATAVRHTPRHLLNTNSDASTGNSVSTFNINATTGALTAATGSPFATGVNSMWVAPNPAGNYAYVANYASTLTGVSIANDAVLAPLLNSPYAAPGGQFAWASVVDPSGRFVFFANYNNGAAGSISGFSITPGTGVLSAVPGSGTASDDGPTRIVVDPTGRFVYLGNAFGDSISGYSIAANDGAITRLDLDPSGGGLDGGDFDSQITAMTMHPRGQFLYVSDDSVSVWIFAIDQNNGTLNLVDCDQNTGGVQTCTVSRAFGIAVAPNGRFAYIARGGGFNTVMVFSVDPVTGILTNTGMSASAGNIPRGIVVDASGRYLFVLNVTSSNINVYSIDPDDGSITQVSGSPFATGPGASSLAVTATIP